MKRLFFLLIALNFTTAHAQVADSAARKLNLLGATNFRDLGGYTNAEGKHVKWGRVYRSAEINKLTEQDLGLLQEKHITTVVDLRGTAESAKAPDHLLPGTDYTLSPAGSESVGNWQSALPAVHSGDSLMLVFYTTIDSFGFKYKPLFAKLLQLPDSSSLLFHCTAGKDRTGIGAALFLYTLGVPEETIIQDYLASNIYRRQENEKMVKTLVAYLKVDEQVAKDIAGVKPAYLEASFTAIRHRYGSIENFLAKELAVDQKAIVQLRKKYLVQ